MLPGSWNLVNLMFLVHQVTHLIQQKYFIYKKKKREEGKLEYVIFIGGCCKLLFRQRFLQIPPVSDS